MGSRLLDMRECEQKAFMRIYCEMLRLSLFQQPRWFRPLLIRSHYLQKLIGYDHWSRRWEYPWAVMMAELGQEPLSILDVGGGGSPLAPYLAKNRHRCCVIDPSMDKGLSYSVNRKKGIYKNMRSLFFNIILGIARVNRLWGMPAVGDKNPVNYYPYSATNIEFPDNSFDRVFCLSVMEHIPIEMWGNCMKEFQRVLRPGGRLVITLDMSTHDANNRHYLKLVESCKLKLIGDPYYSAPISQADKNVRHPGYSYETIGLAWVA